ncbi:MAG: N-acetyl-gamma-glutamyl-phosphate reductase [Promethearchaeia archaeon]
MEVNVGVIAASGYAGGESVRLLNYHPNVNITYITSRRLIGKYFHTVYPNLRNITDIQFENYDVEKAKKKCDVVILGVPHGISQNFVPELLEAGLKVIDLSADFRLKDPKVYKKYYKKEHKATEYFDQAVYGMPELHRNDIKEADLVAVPGCQAASAIYTLYPLIKEGINTEKIIVDSKTGSSGSGAGHSEASHHPIRANSIRPYKMTGHRHTGEIEQELSLVSGKNPFYKVNVGFSAHAVNLVRGILSTCHIILKEKNEVDKRTLFKAYRKNLRNEPFLRLIKQRVGVFRLPDPKLVVGTNYCDVGFKIDSHMNRIVALGALDNLIKGTAGNAVQCLNLMHGFPETTALEFPGYYPA